MSGIRSEILISGWRHARWGSELWGRWGQTPLGGLVIWGAVCCPVHSDTERDPLHPLPGGEVRAAVGWEGPCLCLKAHLHPLRGLLALPETDGFSGPRTFRAAPLRVPGKWGRTLITLSSPCAQQGAPSTHLQVGILWVPHNNQSTSVCKCLFSACCIPRATSILGFPTK